MNVTVLHIPCCGVHGLELTHCTFACFCRLGGVFGPQAAPAPASASASACPASLGTAQIMSMGQQTTAVTKGTTCLLYRALSARAVLQANTPPIHQRLKAAPHQQQMHTSLHQSRAPHVQQASSRACLPRHHAQIAQRAGLVQFKGPAAVVAHELAPLGLSAQEGVQQQHHWSQASGTW